MSFDYRDFRYDIEGIVEDELSDLRDSLETAVTDCVDDFCTYRIYEKMEDILEDAYNTGVEDSESEEVERLWENLKKYYSHKSALDIGTLLNTVDPFNIECAIRVLEEEEKKIEIGDIVEYGDGVKYLVLEKDTVGNIKVIDGYASALWFPDIGFKKTGEHYPEFVDMLKCLRPKEPVESPEVAVETVIAECEAKLL